MKKWIPALIALPLLCLRTQAQINSFDDIHYWVGSGQNRAALVLQWNDGLTPTSIAWGYRWDGVATGIDMLRAIAGETQIEDQQGDSVGSGSGADDRLSLGLVEYSFGLSVLSIDYRLGGTAPRTQADWFNGYWEYLVRGGNFEFYDWQTEGIALYDVAGSAMYSPDSWTSAPIGAGDRPLMDGAWDAYSFAPSFVTSPVDQPVAADLPVPVASCVMAQEGAPTVSVLTKTNFIYQLEYSNSSSGPWLPMGDSEPGSGGAIIFMDETQELPSQRFYRVAVTQAP